MEPKVDVRQLLGGVNTTPERYARAEEVFQAALARASPERERYLEVACTEDPALRELVAELLAAHATAGPVDRLAQRLLQGAEIEPRLTAALSGRYGIERLLGRGGTAVVYLANDLAHGRHVAIKVLRPELAASLGSGRFLREIEIAAKLHHPHILPLYDSGRADGLLYYVMPFVEGETLRDRMDREVQLPLPDALGIAREVADALSYAHDRDIVHRDIKPENILLESGHAVVADFGIARAITAAGGTRITETGLAIGTPAYMSPEQAAGQSNLDGRSDLYSLACVLYEMSGGHPPFTGPTPQAVLARHALDPVPSLRTLRPTVPARVQRAVEKALAKVPADRFATAAQFRDALERAAAVSGSRESAGGGTDPGFRRIESLAVLPLDNLSADPEQEYFTAGMHDALIGELAQIDALRVISRTSALCFKGSRKSVPEIARELDVDAVLEGSVLRSGGRVRIQLQLVRARPEERHLWAEVYDREIGDVLALHSEVTRAVARKISVQLTPQKEARLARDRRVNPAAYEAYLRGNYHINKFTPEGFRLGLEYLQQAVNEDPSDPLPHAALALGYSQFGHESGRPGELFPLAKAAAERALELDDTLSEAHEALAETKLYWEWDWAGAQRAFERALEINPNLALVHAHRGWYLHLRRRWEEGLAAMRRAHELDPLVPLFPAWLAWQLRLMGRHDEAIEHARASLELQKDFSVGLYVLGIAYSGKGLYDEAVACHREAGAASPSWAWGLGHTYALAGRSDDARKVIAELKKVPTPMTPFGLAEIHTALGDTDEAFHWLEVAFESRFSWVPWIPDHPSFAPLCNDPRFRQLVERLQLPYTWSPHPDRR